MDVEPLSVPDVFADRPVIVYGKYNGPAEGNLELIGDYGNTSISATQNFADYASGAADNAALPYLWARKKIKLMSDYGIGSNEDDDVSLEEEITLLGLQYSLVTEYTSFVAVDNLEDQSATDPGDDGSNGTDGGTGGNYGGNYGTGTGTGTGGSLDSDGDGIPDYISTYADNNLENPKTQNHFIKLQGNVLESNSNINLTLENLIVDEKSEFILTITDLKGQILATMPLEPGAEAATIAFKLDNLYAGLYFVSPGFQGRHYGLRAIYRQVGILKVTHT